MKRWLWNYISEYIFGEMISKNHCNMNRRVIVMQKPRIVFPKFWPFQTNWFMQITQNFQIVFLDDSAARWMVIILSHTTIVEENCKQNLNFRATFARFMWFTFGSHLTRYSLDWSVDWSVQNIFYSRIEWSSWNIYAISKVSICQSTIYKHHILDLLDVLFINSIPVAKLNASSLLNKFGHRENRKIKVSLFIKTSVTFYQINIHWHEIWHRCQKS